MLGTKDGTTEGSKDGLPDDEGAPDVEGASLGLFVADFVPPLPLPLPPPLPLPLGVILVVFSGATVKILKNCWVSIQ